MKAREVKRAKLVAKYAAKRAALKKIVNTGDPVEAFEAAQKLQKIPAMPTPSACTTAARSRVVRRVTSVSSDSPVSSSARWPARDSSPA